MSSITDPWPPADPTQPLPYDQRGCCWPWGVFGPSEKIAMRFLAIGTRAGGPVGTAWGRWKTGQMLLVWLPSTNLLTFWGFGGPSFPLIQQDFIDIHYVPIQNFWSVGIDSILTVVPPRTLLANGQQTSTNPFDPFTIPVTSTVGGGDPPDTIVLTPLPWYASSPYPYLGP